MKTGGKQYRVERGQRLLVERLPAAEGADVALQPILYRSEETVFDREGLAGVRVTARVLGHVRGEKLRVFKFKPKRGYKRRTGHRQELTRIEVTEIATGPAKPPAKPVRAKQGDGAAKPAAKPARAKQGGDAAGKPPAGTARAKQGDGAAKTAAKPARAKRAGSAEKPDENKEKGSDGS
ncbi:MAG TPA: 50S ribosomal protein L21 [Solirubrobacteraceae bacterium]|nr:50S ribosomal protein L21 [Solirubrobacteraceae bacterium]